MARRCRKWASAPIWYVLTYPLQTLSYLQSFLLVTFQTTDNEGENVVKYAIDLGYRHFDTAFFSIATNRRWAEDIFITTKLWNIHHGPEHVLKACQKSLENLKLDYIDLYLMHTHTDGLRISQL